MSRAGRPGRARAALRALLLALPFALVFYRFNTPLGPSIGSDNAMYLTMGTALSRGYTPYVDIFDHKGPLLFILQTLPQLFFGGYQTLTVFLLELLFLTLCLLAVDALCAQIGLAAAWPAQLAYLALFAPCVGGGNLSEEYVALFTLAGLLLILRAFGGEREAERPFGAAACVGALAMCAFLTRANNALPLAGACLGLTAYLAARRAWKKLGACALGVLLGMALAALPALLWLASRGALGAAFYGAIVHNLLYTGTGDGSRMAMLFGSGYGRLALLMAGLSALGAAARFARTGRAAAPAAMLVCAAFSGAGAFLSHKFYQHYLALGAPCAALGVAEALRFIEARRAGLSRLAHLSAAAVCAAALVACGAEANAARLSERADWDDFSRDAEALYALVPEGERDRFMAYRVEPRWYVASGALPCVRFYFLQEQLGEADPRVMDELVETFKTDPPRWLVLYYEREFSPPYDARMAEIFSEDYAFVDARGQYQLLRHID